MGWELIEPVYADDGYSGGSMNRPALQQLFQDMEDGKIDAVVIQRLDRICRDVRDICDIIPLFTIPGIALVSVNQSLDTESPQGRLMINMLTSFAQFERELSGERTRDKISAARANGKWQHNGVPLGYYQDQHQELQVDAAEAAIVKDIFQRFSEATSVDTRAGVVLSLAPVENSRPVLIDSRFELSKTIAMPSFHFIFSLSSSLLIDYCKNELGLAFAMTEMGR